MNLKALILTGGKSSRMGTDKFLIEINGQPQYKILHKMLSTFAEQTFISCSKAQASQIQSPIPILLDKHENEGPMSGLVSAIDKDSTYSWLVVACDYFNLQTHHITQLIAGNDQSAKATLYQLQDSEFLEVTLAIYNPSIFQEIHHAYNQGERSLQKFLKRQNVKIITTTDISGLKNFNTPEDFQLDR